MSCWHWFSGIRSLVRFLALYDIPFAIKTAVYLVNCSLDGKRLHKIDHKIFYSADKDECALGTDQCDKSTTQCLNKEGTYQCPCLSGYKQLSVYKCTGN